MQITIRAKEPKEEGKDEEEGVEIAVWAKEKEDEGTVEKRGWLGIPKTIQQQILNNACDTPAGGRFGGEGMYLCIKDRYLWKTVLCNAQQYVADCILCHRITNQRRKPMGHLQPRAIDEGHWQRMGINIITNLPYLGNCPDRNIMSVDPMARRAHW